MSDHLFETVSKFPSLRKMVDGQLKDWPDHGKYLAAALHGRDHVFLARCEEVSRLALILIEDDLQRFCGDYHWMCVNFNAEQKYFARHKEYRLKTFAEAHRHVYGDDVYMARYVRGILLSQIFWRNHAMAIDMFRTTFLAGNRSAGHYLEVGPGHGLFLYFAARDGGFASLTGWEVSRASVEATQRALAKFSIQQPIRLLQQDVLEAAVERESFNVAVISEVLEHLEKPELALHTLRESLRKHGRIFINIPINSPAPDHITLWRSPEEVRSFVQQNGFRIVEEKLFPVTGYTIEQAMARQLGISCVLIGEKV